MSSEDTSTPNLFLNEYSDVSSYKDVRLTFDLNKISSFRSFQTACSQVMKLIRSSNDLSRANDHDFLMSFAPLRRRMDTMAEKILQK